MRATAKCYLQMLCHAKAGRTWQDWRVNDEDSESQRRCLEEVGLLVARVPDSDLGAALASFREKTCRVTFEARNQEQLSSAMKELTKEHAVFLNQIERRLRSCISAGRR